jgi:uncharacterized MAPEG superfamily protein
MSAKHKLLKTLYEAFNARDIELALSGMHHDVDWANGWKEEVYMAEAAYAIIGHANGS